VRACVRMLPEYLGRAVSIDSTRSFHAKHFEHNMECQPGSLYVCACVSERTRACVCASACVCACERESV